MLLDTDAIGRGSGESEGSAQQRELKPLNHEVIGITVEEPEESPLAEDRGAVTWAARAAACAARCGTIVAIGGAVYPLMGANFDLLFFFSDSWCAAWDPCGAVAWSVPVAASTIAACLLAAHRARNASSRTPAGYPRVARALVYAALLVGGGLTFALWFGARFVFIAYSEPTFSSWAIRK